MNWKVIQKLGQIDERSLYEIYVIRFQATFPNWR